jgi:FMN-dependent NADH-azoreductase
VNFAIPYKLKQWFDLIVKPRLTFRFDPAQGYLPLLKNRPTVVILASGSDFCHRHESRPHRHGNPLFARGLALYRRQ